jgi:CubicO group peptidase (beta-lactamase class C family)
MKKTVFYFLFLSIIICSCSKDNTPVTPSNIAPTASFTVTSNEDGIATFTNTSKDADTFEWDFGDGKGKSSDKNPSYQFNRTDKFTVSLKATGKGGSNSVQTSADIKVVQADIADIDSRIDAFMKKYNIPGATLAISKNGKLVYAKGFGFSDVEKQEKVTVNSRFRIGSQSKTFCAVAIMKLIQDGKLKMDDKVFGNGAILETTYGKKVYTSDFKTITIKNLLNHTSGSWGTSDGQGDVMGRVVDASNADFFSDVIDNLPLVTKPTTRMSYANFGYFVLARVVEKVSGKAYIEYLNQEVLANVGTDGTNLSRA